MVAKARGQGHHLTERMWAVDQSTLVITGSKVDYLGGERRERRRRRASASERASERSLARSRLGDGAGVSES